MIIMSRSILEQNMHEASWQGGASHSSPLLVLHRRSTHADREPLTWFPLNTDSTLEGAAS
ncbi:hypothetical protein COCSUDRAFT_34238 [Coccomyxa subellipsoidea C-169]|uniref:Uncharacterized protein n=1 Tax=Coccomyxa subellipsoidea (strain C-169) TaxID=574566 RepID=I0YMZ9_COCSC|nr:hypothetical protein COCSUDRAFT_34238 [Coccomyxa subellipsoidea C-169]EIE19768.1 hypothetical protein COCSUDRAFT_34238 [Coccomyxa subellipsoidea C-169]|eukprot:XP_005644312.1 hypothetical protein COCSUDRAFT_34238 [Coccomyxa subellipsoidea C-169]